MYNDIIHILLSDWNTYIDIPLARLRKSLLSQKMFLSTYASDKKSYKYVTAEIKNPGKHRKNNPKMEKMYYLQIIFSRH